MEPQTWFQELMAGTLVTCCRGRDGADPRRVLV